MNNEILNAGIRITRDCNMKCSYCNIQSNKRKNLTLNEWKKASNIIKKLGIKDLVILGGEPTEYEHLSELVEYITNELGINCSMTTNAYQNYDKIIKVLHAGLKRLGVSVDSLNIKDSISPLKCKNGLELINKLQVFNKDYILVDYVVLNKKNIDKIEKLISYMSRRNVHIYLLPFHYNNEGTYEHRKNKQRFAFVSDEDIKLYSKYIDIIISMKKKGYLIDNSIEFLNESKKHIKNLDWKCNGLSELRIDSDGKMVCCCDLVGTVNQKYTIFDLENRDVFEKFINDRNNDARKCKGCLWPSSVESQIRKKNI